MPEMVADCPRCASQKITFDVKGYVRIAVQSDWQWWYEVFAVCRQCNHSTIFVLSEKGNANYNHAHQVGLLKLEPSLNNYLDVMNYISNKDKATSAPPDHIPRDIEAAFREGATCIAVGCYNAAATMFRLCIDLATRSMLPQDNTAGLNTHVRWNLGLRLPWLFANNKLEEPLKDLSSCIKEDGNDGAHAGSLKQADAEELMDFTVILLERLYTEPARLQLAKERRAARRQPTNKPSVS